MARSSEVIEGTVKAEVGIRIMAPHANWQVVAEVELPYKLRIYAAKPVEQVIEEPT